MFKKSLVALALITASTGAFAAADLKTGSEANAIDFSIQGSASKAEILAGDVEVILGAEYSIGDILTFNFIGGELDEATAPSTVTTGTGAAAVTIGLLSSTDSSLTYRVTEIDTTLAVTTVGEVVILSGLEFDRDSVVAGKKVIATYAAETSTGITIDAGVKSIATIIEASNQYSLDRVTGPDADFDAIIDVEANRLTFTAAATADDADVTVVDEVGTLTYPATAPTFDLTVYGDFAFLDEDKDTAVMDVTSVTPAPTSITATMMVFENIGAGTYNVDIDTAVVNAVEDTIIPEIDFTADVDVAYTDHGTAEIAGTAAAAGTAVVAAGADIGEWVLNGSVIDVPYIPFGPNTQPIIRHTNIGAQTGDVSMRYMVEGEHTAYQSSGIIVTQATPGVRNLLSLVTDALAADGYDASVSGFKVALEITTNVPAADVTVYAAAKVTTSDSDRLTIGAFSN